MVKIFLEVVCPLIGNILSVCMLVSPITAVMKIRREGKVGSVNVLPFPLTSINCFGWVAYSLALNNPWIAPANVVGVCAGLFFTMSVLPYANTKMRNILTGLIAAAAFYFGMLGMVGVFGMSSERNQTMWGTQSVVILLVYYAMPLTSMVEVVRLKNASSIFMPLAIASFASATMWGLYGIFGTHDVNVAVPNTIGAALALVQIGLRLHYGSKEDFVLSTTTEPASVSLSERSPARPVAPAASDQVPSIALWSPPGPLREGAVGQRMPSESGAALLGAAPEPSAPQGGVSLGFGIGVDINAGRNMGSNV